MRFRLLADKHGLGVVLVPSARANLELERRGGKIPETLRRRSLGGLIPWARPNPRIPAEFNRDAFGGAVQPFTAVQSSLPDFRNYL